MDAFLVDAQLDQRENKDDEKQQDAGGAATGGLLD
jgi:hypothetical protein